MGKCENKECCCKCRSQVKINKHPLNEGLFKGSMMDRLGYGCTTFQEQDGPDAAIVFSENMHGLCECFEPAGNTR